MTAVTPGARRVGIASVDTWLPQTVETVDEAVRAGRLSADDAAGAGARQVPVSPALSPPEMAVLAAGKALARAEWSAAELDLLAHAWIYHQGHDFWSPAHYVAAQIGASRAVPLGLQQLCNGGAAALLLGARWVAHAPAPSRVAVTTADRFWGPGFDRWAGDYAVAYGDGATAALLHPFTQDQDLLELLSITTRSAPQMEEMHRGADPFTPAPRSLSSAVDVKRAKKAFFEAGGLDRFGVVARQVLGDVIGVALERAGIAGDDPRLSAVILPRLGPPTLDLMYLPVVQELLKAPALVLGDLTGHLGAGDFLANLADVVEHGVLDADRFALVLGGGGGFSWTAAVVRRTDHRAA